VRIDLRVDLKTTDLVRETARRALREDLHWGSALERLERAELWRFRADAEDPGALHAALAREVERGSTYYNPNKQRLSFLEDPPLPEGERLAAEVALAPGAESGGASWEARIWVTDEGGERADLLRGAAERFAQAGARLESIRCGTLWILELRAADRAEAHGRVAGMALSRGRADGLLLNPHYQEGWLLTLAELP
jgi:hypothetical protein